MTPILLRALVLTVTVHVYAQTTDRPPATCNPSGSIQWAFNSLNQSPCMIAKSLAGACNGGGLDIPALKPTEVYLGPTKEAATACRCSSVFYSVLSACAVCQSADILKWSVYSTNCTLPSVQTFPSGIPPGTRVPHYAFENVTLNDAFDISTAEADAGEPESTALPTPTNNGNSGPSSGAQPPGKNKNNAGAIAGGVVGGVVFLVVVAGLAFWWTRRRRAQHTPVPSSASSGHVVPMSYNYTSSTTPKIYDPSDPSTFPSTDPSSGSFHTGAFHTVQHTGQQSFVNPAMTGDTYSTSRTGYYGMPEV